MGEGAGYNMDPGGDPLSADLGLFPSAGHECCQNQVLVVVPVVAAVVVFVVVLAVVAAEGSVGEGTGHNMDLGGTHCQRIWVFSPQQVMNVAKTTLVCIPVIWLKNKENALYEQNMVNGSPNVCANDFDSLGRLGASIPGVVPLVTVNDQLWLACSKRTRLTY